MEIVVAFVIGTSIGLTCGRLFDKARALGRGQWLSASRLPRDLFEHRWVTSFANLIRSWSWIGLSVMFAGFVVLFFNDEIGWVLVGVGTVMTLVRGLGTPLCFIYAKLSPKYEAEAAAAMTAKPA